MNNIVLTVAVPSYNAQSFLEKNIPTFLYDGSAGEIELIIVDDGSSDRTYHIAEKLKEDNPDVIKVVHKKNGGHGSAVNAGINHASGRYFMICDADDWVDTDNFAKLVEWLKTNDADIVFTNADRVLPDGKVIGKENISGMKKGRIVPFDKYSGRIKNIEMHNCCIKTSILKDNDVRCHEHLFYVDNEYVIYSLAYVDTAAYLDMTVYQYLVGRNGQSVSIESRRKNYYQYISVEEYLINFYEEKSPELSDARRSFLARKIAYFISGVYSILMSYNDKGHKSQLADFDIWLADRSPDVYAGNRNLCVWLLRKTRMRLYRTASWTYRIINNL